MSEGKGFLYTMIVPGGFAPFKSCPRGLSWGGMVWDEINTGISVARLNLVGRMSECYFIIKFSLLLSIRLCWREIRPDADKTTENEFVASFL